jgi:hypothetical protein
MLCRLGNRQGCSNILWRCSLTLLLQVIRLVMRHRLVSAPLFILKVELLHQSLLLTTSHKKYDCSAHRHCTCQSFSAESHGWRIITWCRRRCSYSKLNCSAPGATTPLPIRFRLPPPPAPETRGQNMSTSDRNERNCCIALCTRLRRDCGCDRVPAKRFRTADAGSDTAHHFVPACMIVVL